MEFYKKPKIAIVHDWLLEKGGAEKVLQSICNLYSCPIYTLIKDDELVRKLAICPKNVHASFLQNLPGIFHYFRNCLPLFPFAIQKFALDSYELIISSSHAVAKGIKTREGQLHLCYCHTPMRWAWDLNSVYLASFKGIKKLAADMTFRYLREWDVLTSKNVTSFAANSRFVANRIARIYKREAVVIYPPVDTEYFSLSLRQKDPFYLTVSRLVSYKNIDLIVDAFSNMPSKRLVIIGDGPEMQRIKKKAKKNIEFLGFQPDDVVREYLQAAKAFIFAAEEDFGIALVESQACGTPVIAYSRGGALETVVDGKTGLFFDDANFYSLKLAVEKFEVIQNQFSPSAIRQHALFFSKERFEREFQSFIDKNLNMHAVYKL